MEEWRTASGELISLDRLHQTVHRYRGGPDKEQDLGTINSLVKDGDDWELVGDWGAGRLQVDSAPEVVIDGETIFSSSAHL